MMNPNSPVGTGGMQASSQPTWYVGLIIGAVNINII